VIGCGRRGGQNLHLSVMTAQRDFAAISLVDVSRQRSFILTLANSRQHATTPCALPPLSISDDGTQAAFDRPIRPPNALQIDIVWFRDLRTGQERRVNTNAAGVPDNHQARLASISRDGTTVIFRSNVSARKYFLACCNPLAHCTDLAPQVSRVRPFLCPLTNCYES